jgi:hypothetical protein
MARPTMEPTAQWGGGSLEKDGAATDIAVPVPGRNYVELSSGTRRPAPAIIRAVPVLARNLDSGSA